MARRSGAREPEPNTPQVPPLADVLASLSPGAPLAGLFAALGHAVTLAAGGPAPARELEEALRRLVADARPLPEAWRGTVGRAAQAAHATVLVAALATGRAGAREEGPAPSWARQALDEVLLAALGRDDGPDRESHAAHVADLLSTWARAKLVDVSEVATALLASLADRAGATRVRWAARLTLDVLQRQRPDLVAPGAATRWLEEVLGDRSEPEELRRLALASAHRLLPDLDVEDLQRRGLVGKLPLPPSTTSLELLRPLFDEVDRDQLRHVLDAGADAPRVTTALALAPHLVARWPVRWRDWEPRVRALLGRVSNVVNAYAALLAPLAPWKDELRRPLADALARVVPGTDGLDALAVAARKLFGPDPLEPLAELLLRAVRGEPALSWERRLACYLVLVERWREVAARGDEALADVLGALSPEDDPAFWKGMGVLARRRLDLIAARVASGALARRPLPAVEVLFVAGGNQYDGFYCDLIAERVQALAALVEPEQVVASLERPDDAGRACAAMHVLPSLVERDPRALARRAEDAVLALVTDARVHQGAVESSGQRSPSSREGFALAPLARGLVAQLAARADAARQAALALACLAHALAPERVATTHDSDVRDLLYPWSQRPGIGVATWGALGRALADAVGDRARTTPARLRAYDALRHAEQQRGLAATLDPELTRAKAALVSALRAPRAEDPALVAHVRTHLASIDPGAVAALQGQGHIEVEGVPSLDTLLAPSSTRGSRTSDSTAVRLAGVAARPEQVVGALRGRDPDGVVAALLLTPEVASRASWKELSSALLLHVSEEGWGPAVVDGESLSKLAATRLVAVVDLPARAGDPTARGHLLEVIARVIGAQPGVSWGDAEQVLRASVAPLVACPGPPADLLARVRPWVRDRARSTTVRFRALRLLLEQRDAVAKEWLLALLHDATDDPGLRALAGAIAWQHAQPELEPLLSTKKRPWTLAAPDTPRLPISEPGDVPTDWLVATLEVARDEATRRGALWRLETRYAVKDDLPRTSQQLRQAAARHKGLVAVLRAELDLGLDATWTPHARLAAQLLALIGRAQDTGRVARAALRCVWHVPCGDCGKSHEAQSAQVRGDGRSELDAHIAAGFRAGADRVRARVFLQLGREHLLALRRAEAQDALRAALELAPRSREIARELRAAQGPPAPPAALS